MFSTFQYNYIHFASCIASVVVCSTGTGRTGTMLAVDLCMQAYDDSQTVDIMNCVYRLRNDRAGAVHTTAHYAFIYKVRGIS